MSVISINCLGSLGRWGNTLFQYAFARGYAESIGAKLETPQWIGQKLFEGINDPLPSKQLPTLGMDEHPNGRTNVDLCGYFQYAKCFEVYTLTKLRQWFKFKPEVILPAEKTLKGENLPLAIHFRRGDYEITYANIFCTISENAYERALTKFGLDLHDAAIVRESGPFSWLTDFFRLYHAKNVMRANSTFSWWAATIGDHDHVYSPVVEGLVGPHDDVEFIEGNYPRCVSLPNVSDYIIAP